MPSAHCDVCLSEMVLATWWRSCFAFSVSTLGDVSEGSPCKISNKLCRSSLVRPNNSCIQFMAPNSYCKSFKVLTSVLSLTCCGTMVCSQILHPRYCHGDDLCTFSGAICHPIWDTESLVKARAFSMISCVSAAIRMSAIKWSITAWGTCVLTGLKAFATNHWHIVGLFFMPCGKTTQWYRLAGSLTLILGTEKANLGASSGCQGMEKKN